MNYENTNLHQLMPKATLFYTHTSPRIKRHVWIALTLTADKEKTEFVSDRSKKNELLRLQPHLYSINQKQTFSCIFFKYNSERSGLRLLQRQTCLCGKKDQLPLGVQSFRQRESPSGAGQITHTQLRTISQDLFWEKRTQWGSGQKGPRCVPI